LAGYDPSDKDERELVKYIKYFWRREDQTMSTFDFGHHICRRGRCFETGTDPPDGDNVR